MTRPKLITACPFCQKAYAAMSQHLLKAHGVRNTEERTILLRLSTGRVNIRIGQCPVAGCRYDGSKLDVHLVRGHPELDRRALESHQRTAKYQATLKLLAHLRASDPVVPVLDMDPVNQSPPRVEEEADGAACAGQSSSNDSAEGLKRKLANVQLELSRARKINRKLISRSRHVARAASAAGRQAAAPVVVVEEEVQVADAVQLEEVEVQEVCMDDFQDEVDRDDEPLPCCQPPPADDEPPAGTSVQSLDAHPGEPRASASASFTSGFGMRHLTFPRSIESYLDDYRKFQEGGAPTSKRRENAVSKHSRVKSFLHFLSHGKTDVSTWRFLDDVEGIRSYAGYLMSMGKQVTTVSCYLKNIHQFCVYFSETPAPYSRLSKARITGVVRAVKAANVGLSKAVVLHQLRVKVSKLQHVVSKESLRMCQRLSKEKIPEILKQMQYDNSLALINSFYGYFSALVCSIYGHRPGVLTNMTVDEVLKAKTDGDSVAGDGYIISVDEHKTARDFGAAQIFLTGEEFAWLEGWLQLRARANPTSRLVFVTGGTRPVKNLLLYMQAAWLEMGLPGKPTFIDIRTAVSGHVKDYHQPSVRDELARLMCHSTATADRFYALNLEKSKVRDLRSLLESVVVPPVTE